jgi:hypothetical protein
VIAWNTIFKYLADNEQLKFHIHLPKLLKPYSVFIRHLHLSTPVEDIQAYITEKDYKVIQVTNILYRINKNALPLFRIDLKPATFLIWTRCYTPKLKLKFQKKKKRAPPQCKSCQAYFHTSNFCHHTPRCVKCLDNHMFSECTKTIMHSHEMRIMLRSTYSLIQGLPRVQKYHQKPKKPQSNKI